MGKPHVCQSQTFSYRTGPSRRHANFMLARRRRDRPMHREIMAELRAIRAQMAGFGHARAGSDATAATVTAEVNREVADAQALLETYRAQIEQCEKLKVELDLIHDAINRTKREIATLHGKSFDGEEMAKVNGELGAVVGGTEQATQQILEAVEAIDQAATAMSKVHLARPAEAAQRGNPGTRHLDLRGLQLPGPDRPAHQQGDDHDEVHRKAHHRDDGHLGRRRRDQGARAADRRSPAKATPSCSTARSWTATTATPRRTTSTPCSIDRTGQRE